MFKLNILIVSDSIKNPIGGAFTSILRFAEGLKNRGHKIIFIAPRYGNLPAIDIYKGMKVYRFKGYSIPKSQNEYYLSFPKVNDIKKIIKKEKINLLHVNLPTPASLNSIKAAKSLNVKIVGHSHFHARNVLVHLPEVFQNKKFHKMFYNYLEWAYRDVDVIICPSKLFQKLLKKHGYKQKIIVISNGVNLNYFKSIKYNNFLDKYNLNYYNKRILYVGRLHPEKNIDVLINSMPLIIKKVGNIELDIVGNGHMKKKLENLVKELKIEKHVKFIGKLFGNDLLMSYNATEIFILPSDVETEGMVVLEAMACGKPVITSNSRECACRYFIQGNGLLFKNKNSKSLAKKVIRILKNEKLRKRFSHKSFLLSRKYDIEKSVTELEEVYYNLVKKT